MSALQTLQKPENQTELIDVIHSSACVRLRSGGSKPGLSGGATVDVSALSGVLWYEPQEFTFAALAGTPLSDIEALLSAEGQYLPFDPVMVRAGATLGGTVASGMSGAGRYRFGGVRDFLLGVTFVDGCGRVLHGGGKVVKNAAGFDFPKLMVGALGTFGVLTELIFKVFPKPEASVSIDAQFASARDAVTAMQRLNTSQLEASALEYLPPARLLVRVAGSKQALAARAKRITKYLDAECQLIHDDAAMWADVNAFSWASESLIKVPVNPARVLPLDTDLSAYLPASARRYSAGGNILWASPKGHMPAFIETLNTHKLSGLNVRGDAAKHYVGTSLDNPLLTTVKRVFDPENKFS